MCCGGGRCDPAKGCLVKNKNKKIHTPHNLDKPQTIATVGMYSA